MDKYEVQDIVRENFDRLVRLLRLENWEIEWETGAIEGTTKGLCSIKANQEIARICLDPDKMKDEGDVVSTLEHEMIHLVVAHFDTYQTAVDVFLEEKEAESTNKFFVSAVEGSVRHLERILHHLLALHTGPLPEQEFSDSRATS